MHPVACDASDWTYCNAQLGVSSQLRTWLHRCTHADGRRDNEIRASDGTPLVGGLSVHATNELSTTTTNGDGSTEITTPTPSAPSTLSTANSLPSNTSSGIIPAVIAVTIFVVVVFVVLRILRAIRLNRLVAAYTAKPPTPRMWEVHLDNATNTSFEGKWNEIMPLAAQGSTKFDTSCRLPLSHGVSISTDVSGSQMSRRGSGDSGSHLLALTVRKSGVAPVEDNILPEHTAVLIAMPTASRHTPAHGEPLSVIGPICIGVVDM